MASSRNLRRLMVLTDVGFLVYWLIQLGLPSVPTLLSVARGLGLSARSLQRQLELEGVSFRELVRDVRRTEARRQLAGRAGLPGVARSNIAVGDALFLAGLLERLRLSVATSFVPERAWLVTAAPSNRAPWRSVFRSAHRACVDRRLYTRVASSRPRVPRP